VVRSGNYRYTGITILVLVELVVLCCCLKCLHDERELSCSCRHRGREPLRALIFANEKLCSNKNLSKSSCIVAARGKSFFFRFGIQLQT
jgi:hypothetical protein